MNDEKSMELLGGFCASDREIMAKPFSHGGNTIATDGRILVAVLGRELAPGQEEPNVSPVLEQVLLKAKNPEHFVPLPELPELEYEWVKNFEDCPECEGDGMVLWSYKNRQDEFDCPECNGHGTTNQGPDVREPKDVNVQLDGRLFKLRYLTELKQLPDVMILPEWREAHTDGQMAFTWRHGVGALMPVRPTTICETVGKQPLLTQ